MHFDDNGIRDVTELKILQYRRNYMNSTRTFNEDIYNSSHGTLNSELRLIEVATVRNNSIIFLAGDKDNIWPGRYILRRVYLLGVTYQVYIISTLGYTPIDGIPKTGIASISLAVTAIFILLHIGGVVFALFCLAFNIINRNKR